MVKKSTNKPTLGEGDLFGMRIEAERHQEAKLKWNEQSRGGNWTPNWWSLTHAIIEAGGKGINHRERNRLFHEKVLRRHRVHQKIRGSLWHHRGRWEGLPITTRTRMSSIFLPLPADTTLLMYTFSRTARIRNAFFSNSSKLGNANNLVLRIGSE